MYGGRDDERAGGNSIVRLSTPVEKRLNFPRFNSESRWKRRFMRGGEWKMGK